MVNQGRLVLYCFRCSSVHGFAAVRGSSPTLGIEGATHGCCCRRTGLDCVVTACHQAREGALEADGRCWGVPTGERSESAARELEGMSSGLCMNAARDVLSLCRAQAPVVIVAVSRVLRFVC